MCKEVWCHGLRKDGGCLHEGGENCLKYLKKRGVTEKRGREKRFYKESSKLGKGEDSLKKGVC